MRESEVVSTAHELDTAIAVPNRVRDTIRRDHLRLTTSFLAQKGHLKHESLLEEELPEFRSIDEGINRLHRAQLDELQALEARLNGQTIPGIVHLTPVLMPKRIEHHVEDQVVVVHGPVQWSGLQKELAKNGQCIPHASVTDALAYGHSFLYGDTPQRALEANLPHALEAQCGSWRDWVLGMMVVLPDGTIAKTGSQAVKNVAGYDAHKLFIGTRATLGVVVEVILRTLPLSALPTPELTPGPFEVPQSVGRPRWFQRTLRTDFPQAVEAAGEHLLAADHASYTLWADLPSDRELPRYSGDWVLRSGCGEKNLQITDPTQIRLMRRAKALFDPGGKLNPGEMGIF